mmetsp:Transcript_7706/g.12581  ORF Transcript_7706/g.12581 Transcript_7706/m.12581 type:complete len:92 (+) Transcript_7706:179-454(+)
MKVLRTSWFRRFMSTSDFTYSFGVVLCSFAHVQASLAWHEFRLSVVMLHSCSARESNAQVISPMEIKLNTGKQQEHIRNKALTRHRVVAPP